MNVIGLAEIDTSMIDLVGGKAAGLGELIKLGERVPAGFCLTTDAYTAGVVPEDELVNAFQKLGGGPVAVRSSATAEDLPSASFAGQQDTILNVDGPSGLVEAVRACWASLHSERAIAYRQAQEVDEQRVRMAVVVQRMIQPVAAGVLFTANPVTGCRTETVIDATAGLGTAVVDGTADVDHYVLDDFEPIGEQDGCLDQKSLRELRKAGRRLEKHFGQPQDIEWAIDADGTLWLLQSRAITTLFPLPPDNGRPSPRVYVEFGHLQGMLRPCTPMGMSALKMATAGYFQSVGISADPIDGMPGFVDIGGRFYGDLTGYVRSKWTRDRVPDMMEVYGPRVVSVLKRVLADPRFTPTSGVPFNIRNVLKVSVWAVGAGTVGIGRALARPVEARRRAFDGVEWIRRQTAVSVPCHSAADRLRLAGRLQTCAMNRDMSGVMWPLAAGILAGQLPKALLSGIATEAELDTVLGGLPHNVTTEMDLELWRIAQRAEPHRELLLSTPAAELAARYRSGTLPDIGLTEFLRKYGHRAAGEIDVGTPRWGEDPTPLFTTIVNYLHITDPEQAPDRRFERAASAAEAKLAELVERARRARPVRGRLAGFLLGRARELTGLREIGKFAWLYAIAAMRQQLLLAGEDLVARQRLEAAADIMFLDYREALAAADGVDQRELVAARRAVHERESRRRTVPVAMLSDGTDLEAAAPPPEAEDGVLTGLAAAPGKATGRARVIHDPVGAHIEPGEILVAPTTDPGWTPLFMTAAGLVTETGALIAHGPTVAREYGIPAVICLRDATEKIEDGQLITIDGVTGTVRTDVAASASTD